MIYFEESFAIVSWDESTRAVVVEWKKFVSMEKMQLTFQKALELMQEKKSSKFLGNSSNMAPFSKEAGNWIGENWTPKAVGAGLKYLAYLVPKSTMTRLTIQDIKSDPSSTSLESAYFDTMEAAKQWLRSR